MERQEIESVLAQLADASEVAGLLGLSDKRSVSVYQRRYPEMPKPIFSQGNRKLKLWIRDEIVLWMNKRRDI